MLFQTHFTENPFALKLFLEGTQRLIDVVITNTNLHGTSASLKIEYATLFTPVSHIVAAQTCPALWHNRARIHGLQSRSNILGCNSRVRQLLGIWQITQAL
jgi:hypothetical protein